MIIATVTAIILLMGGGGFSFEDALKPLAEQAILDKDLRKQVLAVAKEMDKERKDLAKHLKETSKELNEKNKNYDTTPEDFSMRYAKSDQAREKAQNNVIELRFKMKELLTAEQWEALFGNKAVPAVD